MLIALLTDIHANREAFDACRAEALRLGAEKFVYLGDLVGYGADPAYVVDRVAEDFARGAISLMGNHDLAAVVGPSAGMHDMARAAIEWTSDQLGAEQKAFLAAMPFTALTVSAAGAETLYVHSEASAPRRFIYVTGPDVAERSLNATSAHVTFCGHVHRPQLYHIAPGKPPLGFPAHPQLGDAFGAQPALAVGAGRGRPAARRQSARRFRPLRRCARDADQRASGL